MEGDPSSRGTQRFSLTSLMREVMRDCAIEAKARKVAITGQIDDALEIDGNPELVRRAVENVLRNAIRFSPEESSISAEVARDSGGITHHNQRFWTGSAGRIVDPNLRSLHSR